MLAVNARMCIRRLFRILRVSPKMICRSTSRACIQSTQPPGWPISSLYSTWMVLQHQLFLQKQPQICPVAADMPETKADSAIALSDLSVFYDLRRGCCCNANCHANIDSAKQVDQLFVANFAGLAHGHDRGSASSESDKHLGQSNIFSGSAGCVVLLQKHLIAGDVSSVCRF